MISCLLTTRNVDSKIPKVKSMQTIPRVQSMQKLKKHQKTHKRFAKPQRHTCINYTKSLSTALSRSCMYQGSIAAIVRKEISPSCKTQRKKIVILLAGSLVDVNPSQWTRNILQGIYRTSVHFHSLTLAKAFPSR